LRWGIPIAQELSLEVNLPEKKGRGGKRHVLREFDSSQVGLKRGESGELDGLLSQKIGSTRWG